MRVQFQGHLWLIHKRSGIPPGAGQDVLCFQLLSPSLQPVVTCVPFLQCSLPSSLSRPTFSPLQGLFPFVPALSACSLPRLAGAGRGSPCLTQETDLS